MADSPEKRSNGWRVRWRFRGQWKVERHYLIEEFEADAWAAKRYIDALNNAISMLDPRIVQRRYLLGDLAPIEPAPRSFLAAASAYRRTKSWSDNTARRWQHTLSNHYEDWADKPVHLLTDDHLNDKWHDLGLKTWRPTPTSSPRPYTENSKIAIMEIGLQVLTFAHAKGMLNGGPNPAKSPHLAFGRTMKRSATRMPFRVDEFSAILTEIEENSPARGRFAVTETQHADMAATMAALGVRIGEVTALAVEDVDEVEKVVYVGHKIERGMAGERSNGTKSGEHVVRPVGVDDDFLKFIQPYLTGRAGKAPLFPGVRDGKFQHPDEWRSRIWTPAAKMAVEKGLVRPNIDHVPHATRYSMGAWMRRHVPVRTVGERFGHKDDRTTLIYLPPDLDLQRDAMTAGVPKSIYRRGPH